MRFLFARKCVKEKESTRTKTQEKNERYYHAYLSHQTASRRQLFEGLSRGIKKSYKLKESELEEITQSVARPPYAMNETVFQQTCLNGINKGNHNLDKSSPSCQACLDACPEYVIELKDDYPQLNLDLNYCTQCGACQSACPTKALSNTLQDTGIRPHFTQICHNQTTSCDMCQLACPKHAIELQPNQIPTVNQEKCDGCGKCAASCYIRAIQLSFSLS